MTDSKIIELIKKKQESYEQKYIHFIQEHGNMMNGFHIRAETLKDLLKQIKDEL